MTTLLTAKSLTFQNNKKSWFGKGQRSSFQLGPIDLNIEKAETVAIIGGNRSGKSLLAKLLCGALPPASGEIVFHHESRNHNLAELEQWQKR